MATDSNQVWQTWYAIENHRAQTATLKAVLDLRIPTILSQAVEKQQRLTLDEIREQLPGKIVNLEFLSRLLTFASSFQLFQIVPSNGDTSDHEGIQSNGSGGPHPRWRVALTPFSRSLVEDENEENAPPRFLHTVKLFFRPEWIEPWDYLAESVLNGVEAIRLACNQDTWELAKADPEFNRLQNRHMAAKSHELMRDLLEKYEGFSNVKELVDVGGGLGSTLATILQVYPHIQGITFDLPHVISDAKKISGVKYVGGDMFQSVPRGDAIFMKYILHDWSDADCTRILKSCFESLPPNGKLILAEHILRPGESETQTIASIQDMKMMVLASGKERTVHDWQVLLEQSHFERISMHDCNSISVIEAYKP